MPAFKFDPKFTGTITATSTLPGGRSFTVTFTALAKTTISGATTFPFGVAVSGTAVVPVLFDTDCDPDDNGDDHDHSGPSPGHGGTPPGQRLKKENAACSTGSPPPPSTASESTTTPPSGAPSTAPSSSGPSSSPTSSQSAQESSSKTRTDHPTPTGGQPPSESSTQSSDPKDATTTGSIATRSSPSPSSSMYLSGSSDSGVSAVNLSSTPPTPPAPTPTQFPSATGTSASGLSAGSTVGIALGVFAAAGILVAAAVFLFLFLPKRKGRGKRESADSTKRHLTSSEDDSSRPLSSTWSWFGSLPIASEPDHAHEHAYGYGASNPYYRGGDPLYGPGTEKGAIISVLAPRTPPHDPTATHCTPWMSAIPPPVQVEHAFAFASAHAQAPQPAEPPQDGAAHLLALAAMDYSSSPLAPTAPPTRTAQSRAVDDLDLRPWDMPGNVGRDDNGAQGPRDPFADPRVSGISRKSMAASSAEVASVEAL